VGGEIGRPIVKHRDILRSSVQKRLNRSRCRLGCGIGWAQSCVRCESRDAEGRCHDNQFWYTVCYNCLFGFRWAI